MEDTIKCAIAHFDKKVTDYQIYVDRELQKQDKQIKTSENYLVNTLNSQSKTINDFVKANTQKLCVIENSASGKNISLNDVSDVGYKCNCKISSDTYEEKIGGSRNVYHFSSENMSITDMNSSGKIPVNHTINENGTITLNGYTDESMRCRLMITLSGLSDGQMYTYSLTANDSAQDNITKTTFAIIPYKNGSPVTSALTQNGGKNYITFTASGEYDYYLLDYNYWSRWEDVYEGNPYNNLILYPQLELGDTATEWVEYSKPTIETKSYVEDLTTVKVIVSGDGKVKNYTPDSEGIVINILPYAPEMEVTTDNENVNIEFNYYADTKKYIDNKFAELQNT